MASRANKKPTSQAAPQTDGTPAQTLQATQQFIASLAQIIQNPLAPKPIRHQVQQATKAPTTVTSATPRRSARLAKQPGDRSVRPSKRGEALLMRKMGIIQPSAPVTPEAQQAYEKIYTKPLSSQYLAAIRDLFPAASALTDNELMAATLQASELAAC